MDEKVLKRLNSMYNAEPQRGDDGQLHQIKAHVRIEREEGKYLYDLFIEKKPIPSLEIGLGYGFSTIHILSAIKDNGVGHHFVVDPYQRKGFNGIGLKNIEELGMSDLLTFYEEMSCIALPKMITLNKKFNIIYIDGDHRFDAAMVDFYLCDRLCSINGLILFHDTWMPSIRKLIAFIKTNFANYRQLQCPVYGIAVFEKIGNDQRDHEHFIDFNIEKEYDDSINANTLPITNKPEGGVHSIEHKHDKEKILLKHIKTHYKILTNEGLRKYLLYAYEYRKGHISNLIKRVFKF